MNIDVEFNIDGLNVDAVLKEENLELSAPLSDVVVIPAETDHAKLKNRDAEDQHPIKAIAKFTQELNNRVNIDSVISALDIIHIMEG